MNQLPDAPKPVAQEPQSIPGGVDGEALADSFNTNESGLSADLPPHDNPATENVPDQLAEPEETDEASSDGASHPEVEAAD